MSLTLRPPYFAVFVTLLLLVGFSGLVACQPANQPTNETTSNPSTPEPTIQSTNEPTSPPTNQPTTEPADQQTNQLTDKSTSQPTPRPTSTPKPTVGGTLRLGLIGRPDTLNPAAADAAVGRELRPLLFDTLLTVDPHTAALQPGLAESWQYRADGRQVVFQLPPDLRWSDGTSFDAAAIAAGLQASQHPALSAVSAIEAADDQTLTLTLAEEDCAAVSTLAQLPLLPPTQITATVPAGSGPFTVQTWSADRRVLTLVPNGHYHGPSPRLAELIVRFLADDELPIALSEGQFDLLGPIPASNFPIETGQFDDIVYPAAQMTFVAINFAAKNGDTLPPAFSSILPLALDRETILAEALGGDGQLLAGPLLPRHWAANTSLTPPPYAPAEARQKLAEAGIRDVDGDGWLDYQGQRLEVGIRVNGQNELHQNLAWLISGYYRDLGLFARAETVSIESLLDDLFTHDFQVAIFGWPILPEPDQRQFWHSAENTVGVGLNLMSYQNRQVDELLDEAAAVPGCAPAGRAKIYRAIQTELAENRPVDFLLAPNQHLLAGPSVSGLDPGPFAPFTWNVTAWHLLQEE